MSWIRQGVTVWHRHLFNHLPEVTIVKPILDCAPTRMEIIYPNTSELRSKVDRLYRQHIIDHPDLDGHCWLTGMHPDYPYIVEVDVIDPKDRLV